MHTSHIALNCQCPCRPWPGAVAEKIEVCHEHTQEAVASRQALRRCLAATGIPLDTVLREHCPNYAATLIRSRKEDQVREQREAEQRAVQAREAVHSNFQRMRHAVRSQTGLFKRHMEQQLAAAMQGADPYSLVAAADARSAALDADAQRARMQMLPNLRSVYAVRPHDCSSCRM